MNTQERSNNLKYFWQYNLPIGPIWLAEKNEAITYLVFEEDDQRLQGYELIETPLLQVAASQLHEYFAGVRADFDLPLSFHGTDFQTAVWKALQTIPYGQTMSYQEIAQGIKNPKAYRAVGLANNRNPISIIIPCHRVVGKNGKLVGYAGGLAAKEKLLELENSHA